MGAKLDFPIGKKLFHLIINHSIACMTGALWAKWGELDISRGERHQREARDEGRRKHRVRPAWLIKRLSCRLTTVPRQARYPTGHQDGCRFGNNWNWYNPRETCKWNTKFRSKRSNRENGPTFLDFPLFRGIFQWDEPTKRFPFSV